eukprot:10061954-Heterocapsa_arctica.AAC.1
MCSWLHACVILFPAPIQWHLGFLILVVELAVLLNSALASVSRLASQFVWGLLRYSWWWHYTAASEMAAVVTAAARDSVNAATEVLIVSVSSMATVESPTVPDWMRWPCALFIASSALIAACAWPVRPCEQ